MRAAEARGETGGLEKRGAPCKGLTGLGNKARSLFSVTSSAKVPEDVAAMRMGKCRACPHVTVARGLHWCECCGCPKWQMGSVGSALEYKTTKAGFECYRPDPAFGRWTE